MIRTRSTRRDAAHHPGLTLVEMVVSIALVGIMLVGAMQMVGASRVGERTLSDARRARELAHQLMAELLEHPYADASQIDGLRTEIFTDGTPASASLGPEPGESAGLVRNGFDDIDDYHGWTASPPVGRDGTAIAGLAGWTRSVDVTLTTRGDTGSAAFNDEGVRRITVSVQRNGAPMAELVALRTLGPPPQEACIFSDNTCLELSVVLCATAGGEAAGVGTNCAYDGPVVSSSSQAPRVLLVVKKDDEPTSEEGKRKSLIESWGMPVSLIEAGASESDFDDAVAQHDVAYIPEEIDSSKLETKLVGATIGVVCEEANLIDEFGLASLLDWESGTDVDLVDTTHWITQPFSPGTLSIFFPADSVPVLDAGGTWSPDLTVLAEFEGEPCLAALDAGDQTFDAQTVAGRRVQLPWAGNTLDFNKMTSHAKEVMQRSILWAAGFENSYVPPEPIPQVVFESYASHSRGESGGTSIDVPSPVGTTEGDLLIAAVATDGNTLSSLDAPAGWTLIALEQRYDAVTFGVWRKIAGASEPAEHTFTWTGTEHALGTIMRFTGHDPVTPINAWSLLTTGSGVTENPVSPGVTTTVANTMILRLGGFDDDDIDIGDPGLPGHTGIVMDSSGTGSNTCSAGAGFLRLLDAGDSGTSTFTLKKEEQAVAITIAIAPEVGP